MKTNTIKYKIKGVKYLCCIFVLAFFVTCKNDSNLPNYIDEKYLVEDIDTKLMNHTLIYRDTLLEMFKETPIAGKEQTCYHLLFYSSMGVGQSIKFETIDSTYLLTSKCFSKYAQFDECKDFKIKITFKEWEIFEKMIYEYNFWTENQLESSEGVLDGFVFILEGVRPEAKKFGKRAYQFIGRGTPSYDKIGSLCDNITIYAENLGDKYERQHSK